MDSSQKEKNVRIAKDFWMSASADSYDGAINEYLANTNIHYSQYGMGIGNTAFNQACNAFYSTFERNEPKIKNCTVDGNSVFFRADHDLRHIGEFRGLKPTNKVATQRTSLSFVIRDDKIAQFCMLEDTQDFLTQLVGEEKAKEALVVPMLQTTPLQNIQQLCDLFRDKGIRITPQQLRCLSLWQARFPHKKVARILGIERTTVDTHLNMVRTMCNIETRSELFGFLVNHGLIDAVLTCNRIVLEENDNKSACTA